MNKTVYISGPMTGLPDYNYPAFYAAEVELLKDGYRVLNPARISEALGSPSEIASTPKLLESVMSADLAAVRAADIIYLLHGWQRSVGARRELAEALHGGTEIWLEELP